MAGILLAPSPIRTVLGLPWGGCPGHLGGRQAGRADHLTLPFKDILTLGNWEGGWGKSYSALKPINEIYGTSPYINFLNLK